MMTTHFGFRRTPFTKELDAAALFPSSQHSELLARLHYVVAARACGLLTGEVGAGKSTAIRALHDQLDPNRHQFVYLADSGLNPRAFYRELLDHLGITPPPSTAAAKRLWHAAVLDRQRDGGKQLVLVLDEAHLLNAAMIQEVRFLLNFHIDSLSPLSLLLVGQPELRHTLRLKAFEAISQRIQVRFHLTGLSETDTKTYIHHQLQAAGGKAMIFSDEAVKAIYSHSRGLPRVINTLCTACLLDACGRGEHVIDEPAVRRAAAELGDEAGKAVTGW